MVITKCELSWNAELVHHTAWTTLAQRPPSTPPTSSTQQTETAPYMSIARSQLGMQWSRWKESSWTQQGWDHDGFWKLRNQREDWKRCIFSVHGVDVALEGLPCESIVYSNWLEEITRREAPQGTHHSGIKCQIPQKSQTTWEEVAERSGAVHYIKIYIVP